MNIRLPQFLTICSLCLLIAGCSNPVPVDEPVTLYRDQLYRFPENSTRGLILNREPTPLYPVRAQSQGITGYVMVNFSVAADGRVIPSTISVLDEVPQGVFSRSATTAARRLQFDNFQNLIVEDVRYVFRYELEGLDD